MICFYDAPEKTTTPVAAPCGALSHERGGPGRLEGRQQRAAGHRAHRVRSSAGAPPVSASWKGVVAGRLGREGTRALLVGADRRSVSRQPSAAEVDHVGWGADR